MNPFNTERAMFETVHALAAHLKILRNHAARHVERNDNVHAAGLHFRRALGQPRLRQRDDEQRQRQPAQ